MITLLIVDDDATGQIILAKLIDATANGVPTRVICASDLAQAKQLSKQEKPDLTFMDLNLPGSTIDEVLESIVEFTPPVIISTGMSGSVTRIGKDKSLLAECYAAGAQDFLEKSTPRYQLAQQVWMRTIMRIYNSNGGVNNSINTNSVSNA